MNLEGAYWAPVPTKCVTILFKNVRTKTSFKNVGLLMAEKRSEQELIISGNQ